MTPAASKNTLPSTQLQPKRSHRQCNPHTDQPQGNKVNRPTVYNTKQWTVAGYNLVDSTTIHRTYREAYGTCT